LKTKPICGGVVEIAKIRKNSLLRFRNFLEEEALAWIVFRIEGEFIVMIFSGVDDIFGEA